MTKPKLLLAAKPKGYAPLLSELERRSYEAAHKIVAADFRFSDSAVASQRRVRTVDSIAVLLQDVFGKGKK